MSIATQVLDQMLGEVQPLQGYLVPMLTEIKLRIQLAEQKNAEEQEQCRKGLYRLAGLDDFLADEAYFERD